MSLSLQSHMKLAGLIATSWKAIVDQQEQGVLHLPNSQLQHR